MSAGGLLRRSSVQAASYGIYRWFFIGCWLSGAPAHTSQPVICCGPRRVRWDGPLVRGLAEQPCRCSERLPQAKGEARELRWREEWKRSLQLIRPRRCRVRGVRVQHAYVHAGADEATMVWLRRRPWFQHVEQQQHGHWPDPVAPRAAPAAAAAPAVAATSLKRSASTRLTAIPTPPRNL
jgi:hypothetical protein